jgi:hypothetical protein
LHVTSICLDSMSRMGTSGVKNDPKCAAISTSLKALVDLQKGVKTDALEDSVSLANKFNNLAESLQQVHLAGKNMDHSSLLEIPVELLLFLEGGEVSNPDLYQQRSLDNHEKLANRLSDRIEYLQGLKSAVIGAPSSNSQQSAAPSAIIKTEPK